MSKPGAEGTAHKYKRTQTPKREQLRWAADKFCEILERCDNRCLAADGCVSQRTLQQATPDELRLLYRLANKIREATK